MVPGWDQFSKCDEFSEPLPQGIFPPDQLVCCSGPFLVCTSWSGNILVNVDKCQTFGDSKNDFDHCSHDTLRQVIHSSSKFDVRMKKEDGIRKGGSWIGASCGLDSQRTTARSKNWTRKLRAFDTSYVDDEFAFPRMHGGGVFPLLYVPSAFRNERISQPVRVHCGRPPAAPFFAPSGRLRSTIRQLCLSPTGVTMHSVPFFGIADASGSSHLSKRLMATAAYFRLMRVKSAGQQTGFPSH